MTREDTGETDKQPKDSMLEKALALQADLESAGFDQRKHYACFYKFRTGAVIVRPDNTQLLLSAPEILDVVYGIRQLDPDDEREFFRWYNDSPTKLEHQIDNILAEIPNKEVPDELPDYSAEIPEDLRDPIRKLGLVTLGNATNLARKQFDMKSCFKSMADATPEQINQLEALLHEIGDPEQIRRRKQTELAYFYQVEPGSDRFAELLAVMQKHGLKY